MRKLSVFYEHILQACEQSGKTIPEVLAFCRAKTAAPDYSDATVKLLQMCDFWGILPTSTRIGIRLAHVGIQPGFSVS